MSEGDNGDNNSDTNSGYGSSDGCEIVGESHNGVEHVRTWVHEESQLIICDVDNFEILRDDVFGLCLLVKMDQAAAVIVKPYETTCIARTVGHLCRANLVEYARPMHDQYVDRYFKAVGLPDPRMGIPLFAMHFPQQVHHDPHEDPLSFTACDTTASFQVGDIVKVMRDTDAGLKLAYGGLSIVDHQIGIAEVVFTEDATSEQFMLTELTHAPAGVSRHAGRDFASTVPGHPRPL